jgi:hypothetical protein
MVTGTPWCREKTGLPDYQKQIKQYIRLHNSGVVIIGVTPFCILLIIP